jgi:hypothetical protein
MDGAIRMDCPSLHREAVTSRSWPKAIITVAWGNAPGHRSPRTRLAEGQTHLWHGLPRMNMAFGQTSRCAPIPGALPQATVRTGLRPDDTYPGTAPLVQGRQPRPGFAVKKLTVDAQWLTDGTNIKTGTRAVSPGLSPRHARPPERREAGSPGSALIRWVLRELR